MQEAIPNGSAPEADESRSTWTTLKEWWVWSALADLIGIRQGYMEAPTADADVSYELSQIPPPPQIQAHRATR